MDNANNNRRLVKNTSLLYVRTFVVLLVQLYLARVLLVQLGVVDFGIYNVVASVVVLFAFINSAMTNSSQRFITYELGNNDKTVLKKIFNVSFVLQFCTMLLFMSLAETVGLWFLNNRLNLPEERMVAANIAYQLSVLLFSVNVLCVPYSATVIAYEKMSVYAYISMADAFLKLGIALSISYLPGDKLIVYCTLLILASLLVFGVYAIYSRHNFAMCRFSFVREKSMYKKMFSFLGWSICGSFSDVATQKGFTFLVNIFFGVAVNAALGIANQVSGAIKAFINSFQTSFRPQIVKSYAMRDYSHLHSLINETSKFSFLLTFIPSMICIVNMPLLLGIWLTDVPQYTVEFCRMLVVCGIFDATSGPFYCAIMSIEKIRNYQIAISVVFLTDLILSYVMMEAGVLPSDILWCRILTRGLLNFCLGLSFLRSNMQFSIRGYMNKVLAPIALGSIIVLVPLYLIKSFEGFSLLFVSTFYLIVAIGGVGYWIVLDNKERLFVRKFFKKSEDEI